MTASRRAPESLSQHLEEQAASTQSCAAADRVTAEEGIRLAYRAAGLTPPRRIVWCGGPVEIARRLAAVTAHDVIGENVKAEIHDRVRSPIAALAEASFAETVETAGRLGNRSAAISHEVVAAVEEAADAVLFRFALRARHALDVWRGAPGWLPKGSFLEIAIGPEDFARLAVYEYLRERQGWNEAEPLGGLRKIAASASWIVPYADVCWIADRPDILLTGARGRLHSADGPALRYRDGWSYFAWKGVNVPAWMIEHPEKITAEAIGDEFDPVLRNTMIDIMTPERFVASGDPSCISRDETGALWHRRWTHRGVTIGSWAAVELKSETAELESRHKGHVLPVPAHIRSARDAVAWACGASAAESAQLGMRT